MTLQFGLLDFEHITPENQHETLIPTISKEASATRKTKYRTARDHKSALNEYFAYQVFNALECPTPKIQIHQVPEHPLEFVIDSFVIPKWKKTLRADVKRQGARVGNQEYRYHHSMLESHLIDILVREVDISQDFFTVEIGDRLFKFNFDKEKAFGVKISPKELDMHINGLKAHHNKDTSIRGPDDGLPPPVEVGLAVDEQEFHMVSKIEEMISSNPSILYNIFYNSRVQATQQMNEPYRDHLYQAYFANAQTLVEHYKKEYPAYHTFQAREKLRAQLADSIIQRLQLPVDPSEFSKQLIADLRSTLYFEDPKAINKGTLQDRDLVNTIVQTEQERIHLITLRANVEQVLQRALAQNLDFVHIGGEQILGAVKDRFFDKLETPLGERGVGEHTARFEQGLRHVLIGLDERLEYYYLEKEADAIYLQQCKEMEERVFPPLNPEGKPYKDMVQHFENTKKTFLAGVPRPLARGNANRFSNQFKDVVNHRETVSGLEKILPYHVVNRNQYFNQLTTQQKADYVVTYFKRIKEAARIQALGVQDNLLPVSLLWREWNYLHAQQIDEEILAQPERVFDHFELPEEIRQIVRPRVQEIQSEFKKYLNNFKRSTLIPDVVSQNAKDEYSSKFVLGALVPSIKNISVEVERLVTTHEFKYGTNKYILFNKQQYISTAKLKEYLDAIFKHYTRQHKHPEEVCPAVNILKKQEDMEVGSVEIVFPSKQARIFLLSKIGAENYEPFYSEDFGVKRDGPLYKMQQILLSELRLEEGPILKKKLVIPYYSEAMKDQRARKKADLEELKRKLKQVPAATPDAIKYGGAACIVRPSEVPAQSQEGEIPDPDKLELEDHKKPKPKFQKLTLDP